MAIDQGIRLSDDRTRQLMRRLEDVYADAYKTAVANNEKAIAKYASLTDEALKDLTPEARQLKREAFAREIKRTEGLKDNIAAEIANAAETAEKIIQGEMSNIFALNYDFAVFDIQKQAGLNLSFTQFDRNQIAAIVSGEQTPFTKVSYIERKAQKAHKYYLDRAFGKLGDDKVIVRKLQDQLIQATLNGESQQKIMRRLKDVTGMTTRQAKRIAQTERTTVQSQGRQIGIDEANAMGVTTDREWLARMVNTRDSHADLNGTIAKEGEPFHSMLGDIMYPGEASAAAANRVNCYCVLKPKVRSVSPALARHREKFKQQSFEQYRAEKKDILDETFIRADTIEQAQKYALDKYGIKADYSRYSLEMANVLNKQVHDMRRVFGDDCFDGSLSVITTKNMNSAGQYGWNQTTGTGSIYMRPRDAKKGLGNLLEEAQYQYVNKNKFWSSGDAEHVIRHELGHSIDRTIMQKGINLPEVDKLMNKIKQYAFDKNENDYDKSVYSEYLSRYGMTTKSEFIAESIAEYMTGNARETATSVSELIIDALKR